MNASLSAKEMVHHATEIQREECDISELWISIKCGESDTITGLVHCREHVRQTTTCWNNWLLW